MGKEEKKNFTYSLDPRVVEDLERWMAAQPIVPSRSAVVEAALKFFMSQHPVSGKASRK